MTTHKLVKMNGRDKMVFEFKELKDPNTMLVTEFTVTPIRGRWKVIPLTENLLSTEAARALWVQKKAEGFVKQS